MDALTMRCYRYSPSVAMVPMRKTSRTTMTRASISTDGCSSSEPKKKSHSVSFAGKANKVYEDKDMGILCYTDENGELVCEGLDEGPRLTWQDMEKKNENQERQRRQRTPPPTVGRIDWSSLHAAVSMGKN
ncbi:uncharacterized protein [Zea mays]|uniref:Uncharacterized protein n=1 Tax=Zea mays TaxID=4577 RepID=B6UGC8_MAIZE|nr:uncharacterized protein LOC100279003 [Zea mays]XP_020408463.1 uncharacterized protein LOC100279003 [Zea mays]ACG48411.1 hypothetical protein [Zea mays]AQK59301.1 hypothetical protein ZEAMMB73_Zm00001d053349 [Zea mays]|eukprot:XP_020408462.1 uncharacterized protein LOC100279003 [Zea mays]